MKHIGASALVSGLLLGGLILAGASSAVLAEDSQMIQDFENSGIALGAWGNLTSEIVGDEGIEGNVLHVSFEEDADQWCGVTVPIDEFSEDFNTFRFKFKGTASKKTTFFFLIDSGDERYSWSYTDKTNGWTTVEIPLKRFVFDGWQPEEADKNKKKDYPFKNLILQRNGNAKGGNDYCIDDIEVVKK